MGPNLAFKSGQLARFLIFTIIVSVGHPVSISFCQMNNPVADARAVVVSGEARFTVLTPQLIRLEWSKDSTFEDHASLVFINRRVPVPSFTIRTEGEWLVIETDKLVLRYKKDSGKFSKNNLEIQFDLNGRGMSWHPGMRDTANLKGTVRTLDGVEGSIALEPGLLSKDGWVLVDDSDRPLFDDSEWPWVMPRSNSNQQDWYFFGHGHEYKRALHDFVRVAGRIPMPPRFAFGVWWSKYWAYTDQELKELVGEFKEHAVPLDVLVVDMDWHQTFNMRWSDKPSDQAGQQLGWTGYTWDRNYFPDPTGFLKWCEEKGLKTPLNLHPASGVQPHEEKYPEMARAMGVDPMTKKYIPFDIVDKKFASNFLSIVLRPLEKQGVDFWWLDWQQWSSTKIPGVTPTWWLNYVFFTDMERKGVARPIIMHRWGGLGNHRYQIGFSGDAYSTWRTLGFEAYFTPTASNVGFGYWSHDIGGHQPGPVAPELYTRWIQFGAFSPVLRTHSTKDAQAERRIWAYPPDDAAAMREAFLLRYSLIPYIYTGARQAYETGVSLCRPMYYDYPEAQEAYDFKQQYMFGNDMIVSPVNSPIDSASSLAEKKIWLPEGKWIEWFSGKRLEGPVVVERRFALDEIPVYVKAGSIVPMQPRMRNTHEKPVDPLILTVFPGDSGSTRVYEDEGNSLGYQRDECAWTSVRYSKLDGRSVRVEIQPAVGTYPGMLTERSYEIRLAGFWPPEAVTCNGTTIQSSKEKDFPGWRYDGDKLMAILSLPRFKVSERVEVTIRFPSNLDGKSQLLDGFPGKLARLKGVMALLNNEWPKEWSPDILVGAVQTGHRISLNPGTAEQELEDLDRILPEVVDRIKQLDIKRSILKRVLAHLDDILRKE
jgi:alpha-glucosidase (family GH31 glycosyl hydrolase)